MLWAFGFGRQATTIGATSLLLSIALTLVFSYSASPVRWQEISAVSLWEWWSLTKAAKALGTGIAKVIPMDQTWKVAFVVAVGVPVAHIVSSELDASVFLRLVAKCWLDRAAWVRAHKSPLSNVDAYRRRHLQLLKERSDVTILCSSELRRH